MPFCVLQLFGTVTILQISTASSEKIDSLPALSSFSRGISELQYCVVVLTHTSRIRNQKKGSFNPGEVRWEWNDLLSNANGDVYNDRDKIIVSNGSAFQLLLGTLLVKLTSGGTINRDEGL